MGVMGAHAHSSLQSVSASGVRVSWRPERAHWVPVVCGVPQCVLCCLVHRGATCMSRVLSAFVEPHTQVGPPRTPCRGCACADVCTCRAGQRLCAPVSREKGCAR